MTLLQVAELPKPSQAFKQFCNSLRCPLCDGQLDGNIHPKKAKLYCCNNNAEYGCTWLPGSPVPEFEQLVYWYPQYEYRISSRKTGFNTVESYIDRYNLDVIPFYRASTRKRVFDYSGPRVIFFNKRMEEKVFLKKLKTYNVFN